MVLIKTMNFTQNWSKALKKSLNILYPIKPTITTLCAEIGCFEGRGTLLILDKLCLNDNSKIYCIDHWRDEYVYNKSCLNFYDDKFKGQFDRFLHNTHKYTDKIIMLRGLSDDMWDKIQDKDVMLDFIYIDGDHSPESIYKDGVNAFKRAKNGGIILFNNYTWSVKQLKSSDGIEQFLSDFKPHLEILFKKFQVAIKVFK